MYKYVIIILYVLLPTQIALHSLQIQTIVFFFVLWCLIFRKTIITQLKYAETRICATKMSESIKSASCVCLAVTFTGGISLAVSTLHNHGVFIRYRALIVRAKLTNFHFDKILSHADSTLSFSLTLTSIR